MFEVEASKWELFSVIGPLIVDQLKSLPVIRRETTSNVLNNSQF